MLGFTAGLAAELNTGKTIFEQAAASPLLVAATFGLITLASIVPLLGSTEIKENAIFTQTKELINGRAAMLGFALMVGYELITHQPIFPHAF